MTRAGQGFAGCATERVPRAVLGAGLGTAMTIVVNTLAPVASDMDRTFVVVTTYTTDGSTAYSTNSRAVVIRTVNASGGGM